MVAVFTGADIAAAEIGGVPCGWQVDFKNGDTMKEPPHPLLVADKVRFVGDAVAIIIAESAAAAKDAAELVVENTVGTQVLVTAAKKGNNSINLSNAPAGVYIVKISTECGELVETIQKL